MPLKPNNVQNSFSLISQNLLLYSYKQVGINALLTLNLTFVISEHYEMKKIIVIFP